MNELELARLKRAAEKALRERGETRREAMRQVSDMTVAELAAVAMPTISERVKRVFGWN